MEQFYSKDIDEVISHFETSVKEGLKSGEASRRLKKYGYNRLVKAKEKSFLRMLIDQLKSFMIIVLLVAAVISGVVGVIEGEGIVDTYIIFGILVLNAFIGAFQERKAKKSLEALKTMAAPYSQVLRDGEISEIPTRQLVPGDIVLLETGAIIPADLRLIEAANLKIKESSLTGESVPVEKQTGALEDGDLAIGDRSNMAFSSGIVSYGRGRGVVTATGMDTEVGKIADMLQETVDTEIPMSRRLEHLGKILGITALAICIVIFIVGVLYGNSVLNMFMTAVSLAVAAIPSALPAVSTVVLAIGVQRMVKKNAIIRNLPSVETLGSATVICSDKTGTLTQNRMTVVEAYVNHSKEKINKNSQEGGPGGEKEKLLLISVLCTDARISNGEEEETEYTGDPTEVALVDMGISYGFPKDDMEAQYPRVAEIPFESERKRMTTVNRLSDSETRVNVKGGLDEVLDVCDKIIIEGEIREITEDDIQKIEEANEAMTNSALRVLAMAYKDLSGEPQDTGVKNLESGLIFTGLVGMIDPARPEVIDAVAECNKAGIRPVMITGDHKNTAMAIAREIGIYREGDESITGTELEKLAEGQFAEKVTKYSVYARVAPEHKVRIVNALQEAGQVVAVTGDGVNDAPALKQADIGTAMGIVGTDVAKQSADMVLTDDNFATIVSAVEEGRRIYDNIVKAIHFLLSTNIGEIFLLFITSIFNMGAPLLPIHILWVNLVTDSLPALALSVDPPAEGIMERKPRDTKKEIITRGMAWRISYQGILFGSLSLIAYSIGIRSGDSSLGQTMAFSTLMLSQLMHVHNLHSNTKSAFKFNPLNNKPLIGAILASVGLALPVLLIPSVRDAFSLTTMDSGQWLTVVMLAVSPIALVDLFKLLKINGAKYD
ncbi:MAG: calcium-translocating P-type ATPase, PMCA-type [Bacteroidota bacterium]